MADGSESKTAEFGLLGIRARRIDGTGETFEFPRAPSAVVRATEDLGAESPACAPYLIALYSAEVAGLLPRMGLDLSGCEDGRSRALRFMDRYEVVYGPRHDDFSPVSDEGEDEAGPGPTGTS